MTDRSELHASVIASHVAQHAPGFTASIRMIDGGTAIELRHPVSIGSILVLRPPQAFSGQRFVTWLRTNPEVQRGRGRVAGGDEPRLTQALRCATSNRPVTSRQRVGPCSR